jgi:ACR3 family arsenite transporter
MVGLVWFAIDHECRGYSRVSLLLLQVVSGSGGVDVGFWEVAKSVLLFLGVPLVAGIVLRYGLILMKSRTWLDQKFLPYFSPLALLGLLYTIVVLFANQGYEIVSDIGAVARVAVPMLIYFVTMFVVSFALSWRLHMPYDAAVTQAFTAASNNFELAIAVAVGAFGVQSQEALAATVGPLIEVPVLLGLVYVALWVKGKVAWGTAGAPRA